MHGVPYFTLQQPCPFCSTPQFQIKENDACSTCDSAYFFSTLHNAWWSFKNLILNEVQYILIVSYNFTSGKFKGKIRHVGLYDPWYLDILSSTLPFSSPLHMKEYVEKALKLELFR